MTLNELLEQLHKIVNDDPANGDRIVILSSDVESNDFSPLSDDFGLMGYLEENSWSGEICYMKLTDELIRQGLSEDQIYEDAQPCLVLWPDC